MRSLPVLLLALLASAAPALAQALPGDSTSSVTVAVEPGPVTIGLGATNSAVVTVTLNLANLLCTGAGQAMVELSIVDVGLSGVTAVLEPDQLVYDGFAQGPVQTYTKQLTATLNVTVASNSLPDHDHSFNITAAFNGRVDQCSPLNPAGSIPEAEATSTHAIKTGPAAVDNTAPPADGDGDGGGSRGSPAPFVFVIPALALAALAARRR